MQRTMKHLRANDRRSRQLMPTEESPEVRGADFTVEQAEAVRDEPGITCGANGGRRSDSPAALAPRHAGVRRLGEHREPRCAAQLRLK